MSVLGVTLAAMTPSFATFTYLATILRATPKIASLAMLTLGVGGVAGAVAARLLVNWRNASVATLVAV